jgi:rod shape-determining protein MreD
MKKLFIILGLILTFFLIYFLQINIFANLTIAGIMPNLFVIFVLFVGLFANSTLGIMTGVFVGLMLDFMYGKVIGISAVMYCIVGYLGTYFDKNFSKENKLTIILMCAGATLIYEIGYYLLSSIIINFEREYILFIKKAVVEVIYNILLTIILYPLIQKVGFSMDRIFKRNNVLTRYF